MHFFPDQFDRVFPGPLTPLYMRTIASLIIAAPFLYAATVVVVGLIVAALDNLLA